MIKFRVYDKHFDGMVPVARISYGDDGDEPIIIVTTAPEGDECTILENGVGGFLMQFTGLLDRREKEIYEGDIIQTDLAAKEWRRAMIVWQDGGFIARSLLSQKFVTLNTWSGFNGQSQTMEVIGNIYEHPGLLEAK